MRIFIFFSAISLFGHLPTAEDVQFNRARIEELVSIGEVSSPQCVAIPEGEFVYAFNEEVVDWLKKPMDLELLHEIKQKLTPYLQIPLTKEGFTSASTRRSEEEEDSTCYSAIWVRDCCWHYFGLKLQNPEDAKTLLLSLLDFYTSRAQIERFYEVIAAPEIADPKKNPNAHMSVPLIRFSSKTLTHNQVDGKDQIWNHLQLDSHGLILLALSDALETNLIAREELSAKHLELLELFPTFFAKISYEKLGDTGPWEEEYQLNASSAGLVAAGLKQLEMDAIEKILLYEKGMARVEKALAFSSEAPDLLGNGIDRGPDSALLFLCVLKGAPFYDNPAMIKKILALNQSLIGPYGVFRYKYDAYQAANYWIDDEIESPIVGERNKLWDFLLRFDKGYTPHLTTYDAQWFFDSIYAIAYYRLAALEDNNSYYIRKGDIHLKRALGQLTGENSYAANGEKLPAWLLPESINTVIFDGQIFPMASPICPLGWSTASMIMAIEERLQL